MIEKTYYTGKTHYALYSDEDTISADITNIAMAGYGNSYGDTYKLKIENGFICVSHGSYNNGWACRGHGMTESWLNAREKLRITEDMQSTIQDLKEEIKNIENDTQEVRTTALRIKNYCNELMDNIEIEEDE